MRWYCGVTHSLRWRIVQLRVGSRFGRGEILISIPGGIVTGHARDVLFSLARFYRVKPHGLLRAIVEIALDEASEDVDWQRYFVEGARAVERGGSVPGCWLHREGGDDDAESDDDAGGDDGDADASDDGDEDMDTNERHDVERTRQPAGVADDYIPWEVA